MECGNTNSLPYEEPDEEKLNEGGNEEASGQGQPGQEAAAAEGEAAGELSGEGPAAAAAAAVAAAAPAGLVDDDMTKEDDGAGGGQENERQPQEPVSEGMGVAESVQPVSVLVRQRCFYYKFSQWQLQELERFFQHNHYISAEVRLDMLHDVN
ncbi:hypothetical protein A6R68_02653 [Neotoma lepida]|uniref:Homeobox domain-containing protein n=1 Tax=Neotoma lepida TaxID=56216 RepID=A0A1A6GTY3_NEOLE|nr:hypothetical protein A6R68_02653 [Neotoma lepida]